ncbi:hypothetical protein U9M48_026529 [Paspalum notatum var. saurae]|uniref:Uncharacterized protein n=1 Tax=Paspalum notatum var. saurae TaxID=547442 RepID=A0AAQ3WYE4_PASNO
MGRAVHAREVSARSATAGRAGQPPPPRRSSQPARPAARENKQNVVARLRRGFSARCPPAGRGRGRGGSGIPAGFGGAPAPGRRQGMGHLRFVRSARAAVAIDRHGGLLDLKRAIHAIRGRIMHTESDGSEPSV